MRKIETTIDPNLEPGMAVAEIQLAGQARPFVISGIAESVIQAARRAPRVREETTVPKPHVERPQSTLHTKVGKLTTRLAKDATAALYDRRNGTQFYDIIKQRRQDEKDMQMARKLGLVAHTHCAKHEKQLAEVRGIR